MSDISVMGYYGCPKTWPEMADAREFRASLECEIEAIPQGKAKHFPNFQCKEDHSLRNNGMEFVSTTPQKRADLLNSFQSLHHWLKLDPKKDPFSFRTSTHVHINCASVPMEKVRNMVLLYALFEDFFFSMVKPIRRDNIHCVALTDTYLPSRYAMDMDGLLHSWHKYTALNVCRLPDLGTLEFRHLHGTGDVEELNIWLSVLENLWVLAQETLVSDVGMLSNKNVIAEWFERIFAPAPLITAMRPVLFDVIRNTLIDVKMSTV